MMRPEEVNLAINEVDDLVGQSVISSADEELSDDSAVLADAGARHEECKEVSKLETAKHAVGKSARLIGRWGLRLGLPIGGAYAALHFPYHTDVDGISLQVQGSLFSRPGISADSTLGNWEFPNVDGLPLGVHVSPENVNGITVARAANPDVGAYTQKLQEDFKDQLPMIEMVLGLELLGGIAAGGALGAVANMGGRYLRDIPKREHELRYRGKQALAMATVVAAAAGYGAASWNSGWARDSRLTGTLAEAQGFQGNLEQYYNKQSKVHDVMQAIIAIQANLQEKNLDANTEPTSFNAMYISDMHLGSTYPLIAEYAKKFGVSLIINTGDESEFGTRGELTPEYVQQIREITKTITMIWLAGNHDTPETIRVMRSIPGVIVLGTKEQMPDGSFKVGAQSVKVYGLNVGGLPDPRVYGGSNRGGSNDPKVVNGLETEAVDQALQGARAQNEYFDIFATHEPAAAAEIVKLLLGNIRQTNAGHLHAQNDSKSVQPNPDSIIDIDEGSGSGGGLSHLDTRPSPIQFTVASFAGDCQETKLVRFSITNANDGQNTTVSRTIYLRPQPIQKGRICSIAQGVGTVRNIIPVSIQTVEAQARGK
ncbi:MAG: metallophosphoesterase [Candidatus Saccharimonadales bacterium]